MQITKCEKCGKIMTEKESRKWLGGHMSGGGFSFLSFDLCEKCAEPLMKYFKKYLKIKTPLKKKKNDYNFF